MKIRFEEVTIRGTWQQPTPTKANTAKPIFYIVINIDINYI